MSRRSLWDEDIAAVYSYKPNPKLVEQLDTANADGVPFVAIIGSAELEKVPSFFLLMELLISRSTRANGYATNTDGVPSVPCICQHLSKVLETTIRCRCWSISLQDVKMHTHLHCQVMPPLAEAEQDL